MVKTSDCGSDIHGFESHYPPHFSKNAPFMGAFLLGTISGFRVRTYLVKYPNRCNNPKTNMNKKNKKHKHELIKPINQMIL